MDAMSINKHFKERGVELSDDNSLPPGQRTQKNVKRIINAVRAAESEFNAEVNEANERCRNAQDQVIALQTRLRTVENQLLRCKLQEGMAEIEALSLADRKRLLLEVGEESPEPAAA
jgi:hypothetical protein